jgi:uncharacterized YccA/Bax inhibitor family protein
MAAEEDTPKKKSWFDNPARNEYDGPLVEKSNAFTVQGAALKSLFLLAILSVTFAYSWNLSTQGYSEAFSVVNAEGRPPDAIDISPASINLALIGCFGGFLVAMVVIFKQNTAPFLAPVYAGLEGLALGAISAAFEAKFPGIALEAVASTLGVTLGMLVLYGAGILRPSAKFAAGLLAAMVGILALYIVDLIAQGFGSYVSVVHSSGPWGVVLQFVIVGVAALNLILDFGMIADAAEEKAPKWYEWYAGFSLLVTLVWLYLEILRLYAKLKSSD